MKPQDLTLERLRLLSILQRIRRMHGDQVALTLLRRVVEQEFERSGENTSTIPIGTGHR